MPAEYLDLLDEEDEASVIDQIVGGKLDDLEDEEIPEPEEDDEAVSSMKTAMCSCYSRPELERLWLLRTHGPGRERSDRR